MVEVFSLRVPQADIYRELNLHIVLSLNPNRVEKRLWKGGGRRRALHDSGGKNHARRFRPAFSNTYYCSPNDSATSESGAESLGQGVAYGFWLPERAMESVTHQQRQKRDA